MVEGQYVQCIRYQSAECPIVVGGIYKIRSIGVDGSLCFDRCGREHRPAFFEELASDPTPAVPMAFQEGALVRLRSGVRHGTEPCSLTPGREYRAGTIDDWQRVFVHHDSCKEWHTAADFEVQQERRWLLLTWKPYQDALGKPCVQADFLCHGLYVGETSWHAGNHGGRLMDGRCTSQLDGQIRAEAWLKQYLRPILAKLYEGS
jgi:hypothetical protein